jgi:endonuclease/exonuclease/phosphatase family metal-dependent hydrolase
MHRALTRTLQDAWLTSARRSGPDKTFHDFTGTPDRRIDWILTRGFRVLDVQTVDAHEGRRYPSDHFPVLAQFGR